MKPLFAICLIVALLLVSCASPQAPTESPAETEPASTSVPEPTATITSTPEPVIPLTSIQTPFIPFLITNTVENAVLRANPGPLFNAKTTLALNTRLTVLGVTPGGEWVFVITPFDTTGWVFAGLLEANPQLATAPLVQPVDVQPVSGQVLDANGLPVTGIQFALIEGVGAPGSPPRTDAVTDANGVFHAFLPITAAGTWTVSFTAVACTSNKMGPNCECPNGNCGKPDPEITTVTLPANDLVKFGWK
ncbi:MAG: SH3 domain-containing protein [Chloroflexi bacterium]|nr:SH3 domain-containing protein [Chloroflexota bacterium]